MNHLTDINYIKSLLKQYGFRPKDYMGQNFLVDEAVLAELVEAAQLKKTDTVLEVGPGLGVLTVELVKHAGKVIAVEKDERLFNILGKESRIWNLEFRSEFKIQNSKFQLLNQDILKFHLEKYITPPSSPPDTGGDRGGLYKVVANIPYYLTSKLIQYFLQQENKPTLMIFMVQKEVGERIVAVPGKLSVLGISVQFYADVELVGTSPLGTRGDRGGLETRRPDLTPPTPSYTKRGLKTFVIPKTSFWPQPKVDSVIVRITPRRKFSEVKDEKLFFRIIKTAFAGKRKQIKNTLSVFGLEFLEKAEIDPAARPQDLSIEQWIELYKAIESV